MQYDVGHLPPEGGGVIRTTASIFGHMAAWELQSTAYLSGGTRVGSFMVGVPTTAIAKALKKDLPAGFSGAGVTIFGRGSDIGMSTYLNRGMLPIRDPSGRFSKIVADPVATYTDARLRAQLTAQGIIDPGVPGARGIQEGSRWTRMSGKSMHMMGVDTSATAQAERVATMKLAQGGIATRGGVIKSHQLLASRYGAFRATSFMARYGLARAGAFAVPLLNVAAVGHLAITGAAGLGHALIPDGEDAMTFEQAYDSMALQGMRERSVNTIMQHRNDLHSVLGREARFFHA